MVIGYRRLCDLVMTLQSVIVSKMRAPYPLCCLLCISGVFVTLSSSIAFLYESASIVIAYMSFSSGGIVGISRSSGLVVQQVLAVEDPVSSWTWFCAFTVEIKIFFVFVALL